MSTSNSAIVSPEYRAALTQKGQLIYDTKLKHLVEPEHNNEYIAIHVDTEDYALGRNHREASQALQLRHLKDGRIVSLKIGPEPDTDFLARMVAANAITPRYARTKE